MLRTLISWILIPGIGLLLMGPAEPLEAAKPGPRHAETIKAVAACGVPAANISIDYESEFQSDVVAISDLGGTDEARLGCVKDAVHPVYILWIGAEYQRYAFQKFADREYRRHAKSRAIPWLKARDLLGRVPQFDPGKGVEAFARGLEAACSIPPGNALEPHGPSGLAIKRRFFDEAMTTKTRDDFSCLSRILAASNADEHDIFLGFIGNEAYDTGNPQ